VPTKNGEKVILKGVSGEARSGEVLAILGPSGAGKTQLMNMLTLKPGPGTVSGELTLNGAPFTQKLFNQYAGEVPQADFHWAFLTCRETIELAAALLPISTEEKTQRITSILKRTGLQDCADTRVGNQFIPGLSGGQKRRLSLAVLLVRRPALIFLDEPTSGLDAAAAFQIMNFVRELANDLKIIVIATIHQPAASVFNDFSGALVLSNGRVAYQGPAKRLVDYMDFVKSPLPPAMGVAEWALDLVNREFTEPAKVDKLLDTWPKHQVDFCEGRGLSTPPKTDLSLSNTMEVSIFTEVMVLLRRHAVLTVRDPTIYLGRAMVNFMSCLFFAIVYIESRNYVQEQAITKMFLIMWYGGVPSCMGVIAVFAFNLEFKAVLAEIKNGMYRPTSYLLAKSMLEIPFIFLLGAAAISASAYGVSGYNGDYYVTFLVVYTVMLWAFECMAQAFSVMVDNPLIGMMGFMNCWFCSFLFAGVMVAEEDVPWPFKALIHIFPFRYSISGLLWVDLHDTTFEGAIETADGGFTCPKIDEGGEGFCYGHTGKQVLDTIGYTYKSISSKDTLAFDIGLMLAIGAFYKLQYYAILVMKTRASRTPKVVKSA